MAARKGTYKVIRLEPEIYDKLEEISNKVSMSKEEWIKKAILGENRKYDKLDKYKQEKLFR